MNPLLLLLVLVTVGAAVTFIVAAHRLDERRHDRMRPPQPLIPVLVVSGLLALGGGWLTARDVLGERGQADPQVLLDDGGADDDGVEGSAGEPTSESAEEPTDELGVLGEPASDVRVTAAFSRERDADGVTSHVLLIRPGPSADLLLATGLRARLGAALLMTERDGLSAEVATEIDRLGGPEVHIIGGTGVVSPAVEDALVEAGHEVHRHAGASGIDTAVEIAATHHPDAQTAILAPNFSAADAISGATAGVLAAAASLSARELPVLLSGRDVLSPRTAEHLVTSAIAEVVVIEGEEPWGPEVFAELARIGMSVTRIEGGDRYDVAAAGAMAGEGITPDTRFILVDGQPDALWPGLLVGVLHGAADAAPILLSAGEVLPPATTAALSAAAGGPVGERLSCVTGVAETTCAQGRRLLQGEDEADA